MDQSMELGELMSFIGDTYRDMSEELFIGAEMTQRQLHHQSPPPHGCQFTKLEHMFISFVCLGTSVEVRTPGKSYLLSPLASDSNSGQVVCHLTSPRCFLFVFNGGSYRLKTLSPPSSGLTIANFSFNFKGVASETWSVV